MKTGFINFIYCTRIVFLFAAVFPQGMPSGKGCPMRVVSIQHEGKTVELKVGESFVLILPNPGSGGYRVISAPEFDDRILNLQKTEKKPPFQGGRQGDFGSIEWTFRAIREGRSVIFIRAHRPWEKDKAPLVVFEVSIRVTQ
jgi:predicted secreted protein